MQFDVMKFVSSYYTDLGVTEDFAKTCLRARLETRDCDAYDDGYEPDYYRTLEKALEGFTIPRGVAPSVLGNDMLDKLLSQVKAAL